VSSREASMIAEYGSRAGIAEVFVSFHLSRDHGCSPFVVVNSRKPD
jgi:hypothetical protein